MQIPNIPSVHSGIIWKSINIELNLPPTPFIRIALWDMLSSDLSFSTGFRLVPKLVRSNIKTKGKEGHRRNSQIM